MSEPIVIKTGNQVSIDQIKEVGRLVMNNMCRCGNKKTTGIAFCNTCTVSLPVEMRNRLYLMIRRSFVLAYLEAAETLPKAGPRKCACGCNADVPFPYKYARGHIVRAGKKDSTPASASKPPMLQQETVAAE